MIHIRFYTCVLFCVLVIACVPAFAAQEWQATSMGSSTPEVPQAAVLGSDEYQTTITFTTSGFYVEDVEENGTTYQALRFPGYYTTGEIGKPQLPIITELVAVPGEASIDVSVVGYVDEVYTNFKVYPFQTPIIEDDSPTAFDIDETFYAQNTEYPAETIEIGDPGIYRDMRVVPLFVRPFTFNPATGTLRVYKEITIKLTYSSGGTVNLKPELDGGVSPLYDDIYREVIVNYEELEIPVDGEPAMDAYDYLIIAVDAYVDNMAPFIAWKERLGLSTEIVPLSTVGSTVAAIKNYIQQEYNDNDIKYVLLVGNESNIPGYMGYGSFSDYYYTLLEGSDNYPDIALGRFCVHSETDVINMVNKSIMFEKDPPPGDWLEKSLLVAHKEYAPGKYQGCSEQIRLAQETPSLTYTVLYPDFTTAYGADTLVGGDRASDADVRNYINAGQRVVNYRGHGSTTAWTGWNVFNDYFNNSDVDALDNGEKTPIVFNIACYNHQIDAASECLGEAWTLRSNAAAASLSASRPSYTTANHTYDKKLYSAIFDEGINAVGNASNAAAIKIIGDHGSSGLANARMYLWLGDPSLQAIFTTAPDPLIVSTSPTQNAIDVSVNADIQVTWDVRMDFGTIDNTSLIVNGSISGLHDDGAWYCGLDGRTVGFSPFVDFARGEVVTVVVTTDVESAHGVAMVDPYIWSFTVEASHPSPGTFYHDDDYAVGEVPFGVYGAWFDADGDVDIAAVNRTDENISILLNNGDATFPAASNYAVDTTPVYTFAADFDADGDMDLVAADFASCEISVLLNSGSGTFGARTDYAADTSVTGVVAADFDGDGDFDLAVPNYYNDKISIFLGNGSGGFGAATHYNAGNGPNHIIAADLDNDADLDLAATNSLGNNVSVLKNNGNGTFGSPSSYTVGTCPEGAAAADFDGDGDIDLATANKGSNTISVLMNTGSGFATQVTYAVGSYPMHIYAADLDADGDIDVVTANILSDNVSVLKNDGTGTFGAQSDYGAGDGPSHVYPADFDGDGDLDLAVSNQYSDDVSILINRPVIVPPVPVLVSPANGADYYTTGTRSVYLSWNDVEYADYYQVLVDNNSDFSSPIYSPSTLTSSAYTAASLSPGRYYWKVRASNEVGWGSYSASRYFDVILSWPSCPVLYSYDGREFKSENPLLTACEKSGYVEIVTDYYHVTSSIATKDGNIIFQLRELEDEITYLHNLDLITVDHDPETRVACDVNGHISIYRQTMAPLTAVDHLGRDQLAAISAEDGNLFQATGPGHLIVTFPAGGKGGTDMILYAPPKIKCPIYQEEDPIELKQIVDDGTIDLKIEILSADGNWAEVAAPIPSREDPSQEIILSNLASDIVDGVVTVKLSWQRGYATDAVMQFEPSNDPVAMESWPIAASDITPVQTDWHGFGDGNPLILRKGDVFEFQFAVDDPQAENVVRDYIIRAVGRYQPDYTVYEHLLPTQYQLYGNYPNPFNPKTAIGYDLPAATYVRIDVFNVLGQHVKTLIEGSQEAGHHEVVWDSQDENGHAVASGIYLYRMTTDTFIETRKMVLLK